MKARLVEFERPDATDSRHKITKNLGIGQSQVRRIMPVEVTDEEIAETYKILKAGVDPNWEEDKFGAMYIGITGKHRVYYTLWKWNPSTRTGIIYLGNAAMNIVDAAKKAKQVAGIQPVYLESSDALNSLKGSPPEVMTFGKYRGKTIGEVYATDPQYVIWLSKNMTPRNQKQAQQQVMAKELADDFFRALGDKRREAEDKEFYGEVGDVFEGPVTVEQTRFYNNEYGESIRFRMLGEENRFQFYLGIKPIAQFLNIEYKDRYISTGYNSGSYGGNPKVVDPNTIYEVKEALQELKGKSINIKGKVKGHKEFLGHNYTFLNYVKFLELNENLDFEKHEHPYDGLDIGAKITLELMNGYEVIGPRRNQEEAERIISDINFDMEETFSDWEDEGESRAMDERDDVFFDYAEDLKKINFELTKEWQP